MLRILPIALIFTIIFSVLVSCSDDSDQRRRMTPQQRAAELKEQLDLTDEQTKMIENIYTESQQIMRENREKFEGDRQQMRHVMLENREKTNKLVEEVLFEDQKEKYQEILQERMEQMRERRQNR
jgi:hypothetical protein